MPPKQIQHGEHFRLVSTSCTSFYARNVSGTLGCTTVPNLSEIEQFVAALLHLF